MTLPLAIILGWLVLTTAVGVLAGLGVGRSGSWSK